MKLNKPYEKFTLNNGVRLILVPMDGVNSVATSVMVAVGSRYETRKISGLSHFLEHMVFKGTKKYPTTDDVNEIERIGGLQNAYTDIDITNYHNKVLSTDWQLALEINKELAIKPRLEQKYVDKERDVILEEMKRYEDEPASKVGEAFHVLMYRGTRLGMRTIGEEDSLKASNAATLKDYHDAWYRPDRIVVVIAGKIKSQNSKGKSESQKSKIEEKVQEWFGEVKGKTSSDFEKVTDHQDRPEVSIITKPDAQQAHLNLGVRTFSRGSDERYAWQVFNLLMGVSFTSILFKEIREKKGLCYSVRSGQDGWQDVGYWSIYAGVATEKVEEATKAIMVELSKAVEKGVTPEEVKIAKKRLETIIAFQTENPEFMNEFYGKQELYHQPILTLNDYLKKIVAVTPEDINKLIRKYLVTKNLNFALVWNKKSGSELVKLLKI